LQFGAKRTPANSLRFDGNVQCIAGVIGDYDGEKIGFDEAVELVIKADITGLLYTSARYTQKTPRWRIVCPFSVNPPFHGTYSASEHPRQLARINGVLRGALAVESWDLSRSYYYGRVSGVPFRIEVVQGRCLDRAIELDERAIGRPVPPAPERATACGEARECPELTNYGEAALLSAAEQIDAAGLGKQWRTLNDASFSIGRLCGAGDVPADVAREVLIEIADNLDNLKPDHPWCPGEAARIAIKAFEDGRRKPRAIWQPPPPRPEARDAF
jgi:hypothetical protein